ncbi:unnamed protein product [Prunus armeniaca]
MDVGQGIVLTCVEGDAKWLNILLLTIVKDMLSEGARAWLHLERLMATVLLVLEMSDLFEEESHSKVSMAEGIGCRRLVVLVGWRWISFPLLESFRMVRLPVLMVVCHPWVIEVDRNRDELWPTLRDAIPAILVNLGWGMRLIPWWGDMEKPRLGRLWMKVAFAFVRPRLN